MIKRILICDDCDDRIEIDQTEDVEATIRCSGWVYNPDDGWEHFCGDCAKKRGINTK